MEKNEIEQGRNNAAKELVIIGEFLNQIFRNKYSKYYRLYFDDGAQVIVEYVGCAESGDSVDFVAKIKNIDKMDAAKLLAGLYHIDIDIEQPKARNTARTSAKVDSEQVVGLDKQALKTAVTEYIKSCIKDSDKTDYFARRGLSADTVKKYSLGYDIARKSVLIPYSSKLTYYQTRRVDGNSFYKPKTEDANPMYISKASKSDKKRLLTSLTRGNIMKKI